MGELEEAGSASHSCAVVVAAAAVKDDSCAPDACPARACWEALEVRRRGKAPQKVSESPRFSDAVTTLTSRPAHTQA